MRAQVWSELEVDLPADDIWAVYSSPDLPRLIVELMPTRFQRIDVLEGDGTQGTILHITLQPANSGPLVWNEQFTTIDHANRIKVVRQIRGGFLDIGFSLYENIFTITERGPHACTIRATANFDVNEGSESGTSLITANWRMARVIVDYVLQNNANKTAAS
ncbi:S-norcoclaurine synthase [Thalictrum thalictroides]|uniref:S-norcoclaurine synthase n=1 Tax=Thalictrum thalictroides TaxID=46969 RepID=A0A7J6VN93_THATH|nr:S-norcoclaurine synthase [Thalictrum thalictroides]